MRIPSANIGKRDLESDIGLDQLSDLQQPLAELASRILRAVSRCVFLRIRSFQHLHRFEHLASGTVNEIRRAGTIQSFESLGLRAGRAHGELVEAVHGDDFGCAFHDSRSLLSERHGAKRTRSAFVTRTLHGEIAIEPAILRSLHIGRAGLHVVLRVEMRSCRARTSNRMNGRENSSVIQRLEWRERRMESKESIDVDRCITFDAA